MLLNGVTSEEHEIYISLTTMLKLHLKHGFYNFMPQVGFKPTTPLFQRYKTAHALKQSGTSTSKIINTFRQVTYYELFFIIEPDKGVGLPDNCSGHHPTRSARTSLEQ